jgi:RNA polymerase sigma-70 factor (ECF subfamily)
MSREESSTTSPTLLRLLRSPVTEGAAWEKFLGRYRHRIREWCRKARLQPADVEEIEGRVLARLVPALRELEYDPARSFRGYLRTVVNNELRKFWQERTKKPGSRGSGDDAVREQLDQLESPYPYGGLAEAIDEGFQQDLRLADRIAARVKQRVKAHVWKAYWLTAAEGRPGGEVANELGIATANVFVAKQRVARMLEEEALRWEANQDS